MAIKHLFPKIQKKTFLILLNKVSLQVNTLLMALHPLVDGVGEVVFRDASHHPVPGRLEGLLIQKIAGQDFLHLGKQEVVGRSQVRAVGGVLQHLQLLGGQVLLHNFSCVNRSIVPVKHKAILSELWPFLPQPLEEHFQGLDDVLTIDCLVPGDHICIDQALLVKERKDHLLCPALLALGFDGTWHALGDPLL